MTMLFSFYPQSEHFIVLMFIREYRVEITRPFVREDEKVRGTGAPLFIIDDEEDWGRIVTCKLTTNVVRFRPWLYRLI